MEQAVLYSLDNGFTESALFLSEQLHHTDVGNENSRFLHALCLITSGEYRKAYNLTTSIKHLGCAYINARASLKLKNYRKGITALISMHASWSSTSHFYTHTESSRRLLPDAAAVCCLLGHLYKGENEAKKAIEHYVLAVKANPYLWEAFHGLLEMGVDLQVKNVFRPSEVLSSARNMLEDGNSQINTTEVPNTKSMSTPDVFNQSSRHNATRNYTFRPTIPLKRLEEFEDTNDPTTPTLASDQQRPVLDASTLAPRTKARARLPDIAAPKFALSRTLGDSSTNMSHARRNEDAVPQDGQRRSTRLNLSSIRASSKAGQKRLSKTASTSSRLDQLAEMTPAITANGRRRNDGIRQARSHITLPSQESEASLLSLLRQIGDGFYALSKFQCARSIEQFNSLDMNTRLSPTILARLGKAHYESGNYEEAARYFKDLRKIAPARVHDMELYSTCLWHLNKEVELSYLAHEMMDLDCLSPQAWCVIANCFSLQRNHEQALKCVARAIQLDGDFAYAHTLEGHEYSANEEFERAQTSFRLAIMADKRHYNAWYGLGMAYMKTGQNEQAEFHFAKASQINPTNAVLVCCIGIVMERSKRWADALRQYERACQLAPQNALARFKKAKALIMARDYKSAMNDLHILKELAPDEANVHYLLGKMYRQFGDKTSAMKHLTIAMNLDNKASHLVKEAIENMDELDHSITQ